MIAWERETRQPIADVNSSSATTDNSRSLTGAAVSLGATLFASGAAIGCRSPLSRTTEKQVAVKISKTYPAMRMRVGPHP